MGERLKIGALHRERSWGERPSRASDRLAATAALTAAAAAVAGGGCGVGGGAVSGVGGGAGASEALLGRMWNWLPWRRQPPRTTYVSGSYSCCSSSSSRSSGSRDGGGGGGGNDSSTTGSSDTIRTPPPSDGGDSFSIGSGSSIGCSDFSDFSDLSSSSNSGISGIGGINGPWSGGIGGRGSGGIGGRGSGGVNGRGGGSVSSRGGGSVNGRGGGCVNGRGGGSVNGGGGGGISGSSSSSSLGDGGGVRPPAPGWCVGASPPPVPSLEALSARFREFGSGGAERPCWETVAVPGALLRGAAARALGIDVLHAYLDPLDGLAAVLFRDPASGPPAADNSVKVALRRAGGAGSEISSARPWTGAHLIMLGLHALSGAGDQGREPVVLLPQFMQDAAAVVREKLLGGGSGAGGGETGGGSGASPEGGDQLVEPGPPLLPREVAGSAAVRPAVASVCAALRADPAPQLLASEDGARAARVALAVLSLQEATPQTRAELGTELWEKLYPMLAARWDGDA